MRTACSFGPSGGRDFKAAQIPGLTRMKARIEIVGDFADLKRIAEVLKQMAAKD
jgi:hypothetical protein